MGPVDKGRVTPTGYSYSHVIMLSNYKSTHLFSSSSSSSPLLTSSARPLPPQVHPVRLTSCQHPPQPSRTPRDVTAAYQPKRTWHRQSSWGQEGPPSSSSRGNSSSSRGSGTSSSSSSGCSSSGGSSKSPGGQAGVHVTVAEICAVARVRCEGKCLTCRPG